MNPKPNEPEKNLGAERRQYKRISKSFILSYFEKSNPEQKFEITQLRNISQGGMCFITTRSFMPNTRLGVELRTPYLAETTYLEGDVLGSHEKIKGMLYETRLQFTLINSQAEFLLSKLIEFFVSPVNEVTGDTETPGESQPS